MKQALWLVAATSAAFLAVHAGFGYPAAIGIGYGAIMVMSTLIAATFLWLWWQRTTPLALGMAMSWAGTASVTGWWWAAALAGRPEAMSGNGALLPFLSLQIAGAVLHFDVMQTSMGLRRRVFVLPVVAAFAAGAAAAAFTKS